MFLSTLTFKRVIDLIWGMFMGVVTTVRKKGQITIPAEIRDQVHIEEGMVVELSITESGILLRPKILIDPDQAWFWTEEWQKGEREADADIAAGRTTYFESDESFQAALEEFSRTGRIPPGDRK